MTGRLRTISDRGLEDRPTDPPGSRPSSRQRRRRVRGLAWWFLSRISPARRIALVVVAVFDLIEVVLLSAKGFEQHNGLALVLGFAILILLVGFEVAEHAATKRDHDLSCEISEWLLPHIAPSLDGIEIAFGNRMANHVGSDYFNVFPRWARDRQGNTHQVFVVMADVAGIGLQGALLMATFQASLRVLADSKLPLCELASEMNQWSWDRSLEGRHFTMAFLADLDPVVGSLEYVSAGHQPPLIRRGSGEIERLELGGFPLGALSDSRYEMGSTVLQPGDSLVVFTDGVVKAENHRRELFGEDRVMRALRMSGATAHEISNHLNTSMLSFCGATKQPDDMSFIVVRKSS